MNTTELRDLGKPFAWAKAGSDGLPLLHTATRCEETREAWEVNGSDTVALFLSAPAAPVADYASLLDFVIGSARDDERASLPGMSERTKNARQRMLRLIAAIDACAAPPAAPPVEGGIPPEAVKVEESGLMLSAGQWAIPSDFGCRVVDERMAYGWNQCRLAMIEREYPAAPAARPSGDDLPCTHEPYQGRCMHCDVEFRNGKPVGARPSGEVTGGIRVGTVKVIKRGRSSVDLDASHADLPPGEYALLAALSPAPGNGGLWQPEWAGAMYAGLERLAVHLARVGDGNGKVMAEAQMASLSRHAFRDPRPHAKHQRAQFTAATPPAAEGGDEVERLCALAARKGWPQDYDTDEQEVMRGIVRTVLAASPTPPAAPPGVDDAMVERAMNALIPGGSQAWVWLFNCEGGMAPLEKHRDWFRRVLLAALNIRRPAASEGGQ